MPRHPRGLVTDLCPHDDDPATCPPCRRDAGKDEPAPVYAEVGREFQARYAGTCAGPSGCGGAIYAGQTCRIVTRGADRHTVHTLCAPF